MVKAVADTQALLWFLQKDARLSAAALHTMNSAPQAGHQIAISSITLVEVAYLIEKNRIALDSFDLIIQLLQTSNSMLKEVPLDQQVADSLRQVVRAQVPEMPDRIIAATALMLGAATALMLGVPVISRDHKIQASSIATIW